MEPHHPAPRKRSDPDLGPAFAGFCHIEKRSGKKPRHFVVHSRAPRFSAEVEFGTSGPAARGTGVIRSVRMPNSWSGDYDRAGALLGPAMAFAERARELDARTMP